MNTLTAPLTGGFARRLRESTRPLWGTWVKLPALETVEMLAGAGFDFIVIDQEHSPLGLESAYRATVLAQSLGIQVLVRVPDRSGSHVQRLLDLGVDGILVPRIGGAQEARDVVRQMVFSPNGDRGLGITARAGRWGGISRAAYVDHGDANVLRAVQVEDIEVLEQVGEILDAPGLNGAFLGLGDLTLSSGLPASDPRIVDMTTRFLELADARGIPCGTAVQTVDQAQAAGDRGFAFVMISNDARIFREAAMAIGQALQQQDEQEGEADGHR